MRCPANRHWIGSLTVALAVACGPGSAQAPAPVPVPSKTPAQVSGAVVDATGAAITGAQVTVTDVATGQKYTTKSDDRGFFQFSNLTPGDLRLTAELSGFSDLSRSLSTTPGTTTTLTLQFASGPVPVTGPGPAARPELSVMELTLDGPGLSDLVRSEATNHRVLSAIVGIAERRSLFVFEKSDDAAIVYEMVPAKRPLLPADLQALLAPRARMTFLGVHSLGADSSVAVFRHGR